MIYIYYQGKLHRVVRPQPILGGLCRCPYGRPCQRHISRALQPDAFGDHLDLEPGRSPLVDPVDGDRQNDVSQDVDVEGGIARSVHAAAAADRLHELGFADLLPDRFGETIGVLVTAHGHASTVPHPHAAGDPVIPCRPVRSDRCLDRLDAAQGTGVSFDCGRLGLRSPHGDQEPHVFVLVEPLDRVEVLDRDRRRQAGRPQRRLDVLLRDDQYGPAPGLDVPPQYVSPHRAEVAPRTGELLLRDRAPEDLTHANVRHRDLDLTDDLDFWKPFLEDRLCRQRRVHDERFHRVVLRCDLADASCTHDTHDPVLGLVVRHKQPAGDDVALKLN